MYIFRLQVAEDPRIDLAKAHRVYGSFAVWRDGAVYEFGVSTTIESPAEMIETFGCASISLRSCLRSPCVPCLYRPCVCIVLTVGCTPGSGTTGIRNAANVVLAAVKLKNLKKKREKKVSSDTIMAPL